MARVFIPGFRKIEVSGGGEGGTTNYNDLTNKPSINNVPLVGNLNTANLKLTDSTLTEEGVPAEAKTVGDKLAEQSSNLTSEIIRAKETEETLKSRIDNIASLPEGSTTGDAELQDIRVKADGTTATSAGNAVREQFSDLKSDLDKLEMSIQAYHVDMSMFIQGSFNDGYKYKPDVSNKSSIYTEYLIPYPVDENAYLELDEHYTMRLIGYETNSTGYHTGAWVVGKLIFNDYFSQNKPSYFRIGIMTNPIDTSAIVEVNDLDSKIKTNYQYLLNNKIKKLEENSEFIKGDISYSHIDILKLVQGAIDDAHKSIPSGEDKAVTTILFNKPKDKTYIKSGSQYLFRVFKYDSVTSNFKANSSWTNNYIFNDSDDCNYYRVTFMTNELDESAILRPTDFKGKIETDIVELISDISLKSLDERIKEVEVEKSVILKDSKPIIFDTDWWTDIDDAVALRVLTWAERMGMVDIMGIVIDAVRSTSAKSLDTFMNYEGRGGLCIALDKDATDYDGTPSYHQTMIDSWQYRNYNNNDECEDSNEFYIRALTSLGENERANIIAVGYPNAISKLLNLTNITGVDGVNYANGIELVNAKVDKMYMMAGLYPSGLENNFKRTERSRQAGKNVCDKFPRPIIFLGFEVGETVLTGGNVENACGTYDLLYKGLLAHGSSNGRSAWDNMLTLLACYDDAEVAGYNLVRGTNIVDDTDGSNIFTPNSSGQHYYVTKKYPDSWYQRQINSILEQKAWGMRVLGGHQISKP